MARRDPEARFLEKVDKVPGGCWNWKGAKSAERDGVTYYGYFAAGGAKSQMRVHRWSYQYYVGQIPEGFTIDHLCRNTLCVNPQHLEPVTQRENLRRSDVVTGKRSGATHCPRGHEYSTKNTAAYTNKRGYSRRKCRTCASAVDAARWRTKHPPKPPRTHCLHGHPFDAENTFLDAGGKPACRQCRKDRAREWRERRAALSIDIEPH
jgi:hypothetical protein